MFPSDSFELDVLEGNEPSQFEFSAELPGLLNLTPGAVALREADGKISDVLRFLAIPLVTTTFVSVQVQSADSNDAPAGALRLKEGVSLDLTDKFRDVNGNPITLPFGVTFGSNSGENFAISDGLLIDVPTSLELTLTNMHFLGTFDNVPGMRNGAVALIEPPGEGDEGAISDVVKFSVVSPVGPTSSIVSVDFQSDTTGVLVPPAGADNVDETGGPQDLTSLFTDTSGTVALPFEVLVVSDAVPEPSTLVLSSILLGMFGARSLRKRRNATGNGAQGA